MFEINDQKSVYMLVVLTCSRLEYTSIELRRGTHKIRASYT